MQCLRTDSNELYTLRLHKKKENCGQQSTEVQNMRLSWLNMFSLKNLSPTPSFSQTELLMDVFTLSKVQVAMRRSLNTTITK